MILGIWLCKHSHFSFLHLADIREQLAPLYLFMWWFPPKPSFSEVARDLSLKKPSKPGMLKLIAFFLSPDDVAFLYSGSLWSSLYCGVSSLWVGLYQWLVKVSWLGKLVSVFWWVELDFFSMECNEISSSEFPKMGNTGECCGPWLRAGGEGA